VEIVLLYRGRIPSRSKDKNAVWAMRREFYRQLEKLWGKEPFGVLRRWEETGTGGGAPAFIRVKPSGLRVTTANIAMLL